MKIVIYGGSFDPIHNGHKAIIAELYNKFDKVLIIPAKYKNNMMFNDNMRLLFIQEYINMCYSNCNKIEVITDELADETNELSKTYNMIKHIINKLNVNINNDNNNKNKLNINNDNNKNNNFELYLCIGYDQYENLKNWYRYQDLLKLVKLVVINRGDSKNENLYSNLNIELLYLTIHGYEDVSSTKIREQIHNYILLN